MGDRFYYLFTNVFHCLLNLLLSSDQQLHLPHLFEYGELKYEYDAGGWYYFTSYVQAGEVADEGSGCSVPATCVVGHSPKSLCTWPHGQDTCREPKARHKEEANSD